MNSLNNLDIDKALSIYEKHPTLINNIINRAGRIHNLDLFEFTNAFGSNFIVCLIDPADSFRILVTVEQFAILNKNRTTLSKNDIILILCDSDFELLRESTCLYKIRTFL